MSWKGLITDMMGFSGMACLGYGCWLIYPPLALIVIGLAMLAGAYIAATRNEKEPE